MSPQAPHDPKNEAEITYWNSAGGRRWVERQKSQDIVLGPILQARLQQGFGFRRFTNGFRRRDLPRRIGKNTTRFNRSVTSLMRKLARGL